MDSGVIVLGETLGFRCCQCGSFTAWVPEVRNCYRCEHETCNNCKAIKNKSPVTAPEVNEEPAEAEPTADVRTPSLVTDRPTYLLWQA